MNLPLVSIIIPVYNSSAFLAATIQSAINQTWPNKEIIIVDDESTDNSLEIAKKFETDGITILSQKNLGASAARNHGLKKSKGKYIQFLDADDLLLPQKIALQVNVLEKNPNSVAIGPSIHFFNKEGHVSEIPKQNFFSEFNNPKDFVKILFGGTKDYPGTMVEIHSWLAPKTILDKIDPWNESLSVDDDGEYYLRVALASIQIIYVESAMVLYRKHSGQISLSSGIKNRKGLLSSVNSIEMKRKLLIDHFPNEQLANLLARSYWELAFLSYPKQKKLFELCSNRSKELNYQGKRFQGGKIGKLITKIFGWKIARRLQLLWY
ncbi:glycosyltransferase family 2 protein [Pedobacter sp. HDW13]|uniref:glycosyltransferase family 2 protein n=1 Tax=Pedobacter sp. HDW13 TaxID=2714940 RepID=UPI00140D5FF6|nr:glycosyltransferase family 2 protein [Pedobacter sp. HDW13]QIL40666.1 glycosyltransferase family 2 protein [Pedobacter sp. HDW13]